MIKSGDLSLDGYYKGIKVTNMSNKSVREVYKVFGTTDPPNITRSTRNYYSEKKKRLSLWIPITIQVINGKTYKEVSKEIDRTTTRVAQIIHQCLRATNCECELSFSYKEQKLVKVRENRNVWLKALKELALKYDVNIIPTPVKGDSK